MKNFHNKISRSEEVLAAFLLKTVKFILKQDFPSSLPYFYSFIRHEKLVKIRHVNLMIIYVKYEGDKEDDGFECCNEFFVYVLLNIF